MDFKTYCVAEAQITDHHKQKGHSFQLVTNVTRTFSHNFFYYLSGKTNNSDVFPTIQQFSSSSK